VWIGGDGNETGPVPVDGSCDAMAMTTRLANGLLSQEIRRT
jgi:hypothetical protein